jgi:hypothetical protein
LVPVFNFRSGFEIHRLQERMAASTATAAMMAMQEPRRRKLGSRPRASETTAVCLVTVGELVTVTPTRVVAAAAEVRIAAADDSTAIATAAAKATAREVVISM